MSRLTLITIERHIHKRCFAWMPRSVSLELQHNRKKSISIELKKNQHPKRWRESAKRKKLAFSIINNDDYYNGHIHQINRLFHSLHLSHVFILSFFSLQMQNVLFPFQNSRNITFNNCFSISPLNTLDFGLVFSELRIHFIHSLIRLSAQKMGATSSHIDLCDMNSISMIWLCNNCLDDDDVHPFMLMSIESGTIETYSLFVRSVRKSVTNSGMQKHDDWMYGQSRISAFDFGFISFLFLFQHFEYCIRFGTASGWSSQFMIYVRL